MRDQTMRFAAIGVDHRHIYHMVGELIAAGATCAGYDPSTSDPRVLAGFQERFPELAPIDRQILLDDSSIALICSAAVPSERAPLAMEAMRRGKDVMVDKPGVTSFAQLAEVRRAVEETGRIFSICFSERFIVPATEVAAKLVGTERSGASCRRSGLGRTG